MIFIVLWNVIFNYLWIKKTPLSYFYEEPKNSLDVIYIGHSNAYQHFNTTLAFEKYGFTTGLMTTDAQNFAGTEYLIKESQKYIIDLAKAADNLSAYTDGEFRQLPDSMKFTQNRIDVINKILSYKDTAKEEYINYYFSFLIYHNRWKDLLNGEIENRELFKGFEIIEKTVETYKMDKYNWSSESNSLQEENKIVLQNLIDYIKQNNLNVVFVVPIRTYSKDSDKRLNEVIKIINENNLNVVNFNTLEDLNINFETDFYNTSHLNIYGSTKYTLYFSKYLKENYNLPNHRDNIYIYNSWNREYIKFKEKFKELTNKDFEKLIKEYDIY